MEKNKILWVTRLQLDGALDVVTWQAMTNELKRLDCDVKILLCGKDTKNIFKGAAISIPEIKIKGLRIVTYFIFGYCIFLSTFLKEKPNILILNIFNFWFTFPLLLFKSKKNLKIIIDHRTPYFKTEEGSSLRDAFNYLLTKVCFLYSKVFRCKHTVINEYLKTYFSKLFKYPKSRIGIWSSGVNLDLFDVEKKRNRPDFLKNKFVLMQHGSWTFNRSLLETIEAFKYIKNDNICLVLIGNGPAQKSMSTMVKKYGLGKSVFLLPPVELKDIPYYISYCDCAIMVYPKIFYWDVNVPLKLLEYLAMNKLVICADTPCFRNVFSGVNQGIYISENSPKKIRDKILDTYKNFKDLTKDKNFRKITEEKYTWAKQAESLLHFIENK